MRSVSRNVATASVAVIQVILFAAPAFAGQDSASAGAEILQHTSLTSLLDLDFGTIATNNNGGVIMLNAGNDTRACASGMVCTGSFGFATLYVTGTAATNVQVTYSGAQLTGPGQPMNVNLLFPGGSGAVIPLTGGSATVKFGAELYVNTNQTQGTYNGQIAVNVNYY